MSKCLMSTRVLVEIMVIFRNEKKIPQNVNLKTAMERLSALDTFEFSSQHLECSLKPTISPSSGL